MARKSKKPVRKQPHSPTGKVVGQVEDVKKLVETVMSDSWSFPDSST